MELAIIAHDGKKAEMVQFLMNHKEILDVKEIDIISTGPDRSETIIKRTLI